MSQMPYQLHYAARPFLKQYNHQINWVYLELCLELSVCMGWGGFPLPKQSQKSSPSHEMALDLWECSGAVKKPYKYGSWSSF